MSQMRAVLVKGGAGGIKDLFIGEAPKPVPLANEVLVKVKAFGVNRMDIIQREGKYPVPAGASKILGVEFSGTIAEVGKEVTQWKLNDEVLGLVGGGAYAEFVLAPETHIWHKPAHLSWVDAAAVPENWITAYQALTIAEFQPGDNVLIHTGASGVGLAANQLARTWNASNVITTASSSAKLEWLLKMPNGPTHAVNYKTQDFAAEVKTITDGKGVDVIVDFPGQSHFVKNLDALAVDGRMTMLALLSGAEVPSLNLVPILYKRLRIQGSTLRARSQEYQAELIQRFRQSVADKLTGEDGSGPLRTFIHAVYPMDKIQDAHQDMESNGTAGKLIVTV
ncbi:quinone oxidoreductase [Gautieria morchelliformis]|nr:quinone oxidoreductase [Gautieria morchelliformis]